MVNVGHLMAYVDEQREEGNAAYRKREHSAALAAWQRGLDAIAQADGKPIARADMRTVLKARSVLHSNRGQALMSMQFWRRAADEELSEALKIDPTNAKALWRRFKAQRELKRWAEAEADLEALLAPEMQEAAGPLLASAGLGAEQIGEVRVARTLASPAANRSHHRPRARPRDARAPAPRRAERPGAGLARRSWRSCARRGEPRRRRRARPSTSAWSTRRPRGCASCASGSRR